MGFSIDVNQLDQHQLGRGHVLRDAVVLDQLLLNADGILPGMRPPIDQAAALPRVRPQRDQVMTNVSAFGHGGRLQS